jgi:betaine-aldehyde dehydrogenase
MKAASGNVKKLALELGGKNPHIIFADTDLEKALDSVLNGVFFHAGQICSAGTRLMIEEAIHDTFVDMLKSAMEKIKIGYGFDKDTQMGPLISSAHRDKIENYVKTGIKEGARLLLGGERPKNPGLQKGYYYAPTLFTGCDENMKIVQEESFGPVITVEKFATEEEAVEKANSTVYGLSAGFRTNDPDRIFRVSRALRFGTVWINDFNIYFTEAPWGGYRQSGLGRELGKTGFEEYTEIKHIFQNHNYRPVKWFNTGPQK